MEQRKKGGLKREKEREEKQEKGNQKKKRPRNQKTPDKDLNKDDLDEDSAASTVFCPQCLVEENKDDNDTWIQCDGCNLWYHSQCAGYENLLPK